MLAVKNLNIELIKLLLQWKADINIQNAQGESALTQAIKSGKELLVNTLLENAYNIEIDKAYKDGNTPLILAVGTDNPTIVAKILAEVPNPHKENLNHKTVFDFIHNETEAGFEIVKLFVKITNQYKLHQSILFKDSNTIGDLNAIKKLDVPLNIESVERNPLVVAIGTGSQTIVEAIVKKGANINQLLRGNKTSLWQAIEKIDLNILDFLLANGAKKSVDIADIYDDYTPIFEAVKFDRKEVVEKLIANGANVNYQATSLFPGVPGKMTPLMLAADILSIESVKLLLNAGADPLMKNSEGKTALDIVLEKKEMSFLPRDSYKKIIALLEDKIKTISPAKPVTLSQLIFLLQNLTQQLNALLKVLQKN